MSEQARPYLVFYETFEMRRHPQTEERVQVVYAYTAEDALTDVRLRLKEGAEDAGMQTTIVAVVPPTTDRHERLMEEAQMTFRYMNRVVPYHDAPLEEAKR